MMRLLLILMLYVGTANASDNLRSSQKISQAGMQAQSERMKVVAQNIANANSTADSPDKNPYTRKILNVKNSTDNPDFIPLLKVDNITSDASAYNLKYEPGHPAADSDGYVKYPNVDINLEMIDAKEAQVTFEANLSAYEIAKSNQQKLLEALK